MVGLAQGTAGDQGVSREGQVADVKLPVQGAGTTSHCAVLSRLEIVHTEQRSKPMQPRMNYYQAAPEALKPMLDMEAYIKTCGLEQKLIELVKTSASQINGCAYCLHMHTKDARAAGESEPRLYLLNAWEESQLYTARERAALAWTEALTLISETHAP